VVDAESVEPDRSVDCATPGAKQTATSVSVPTSSATGRGQTRRLSTGEQSPFRRQSPLEPTEWTRRPTGSDRPCARQPGRSRASERRQRESRISSGENSNAIVRTMRFPARQVGC
jgi:hypothetical protein